MKVLVVSDIHGNLPALEKVLALEGTADLIISLGDVVSYGPWSNECVSLLDGLPNTVLIMGNHDMAFIEGKYYGTNEIAVTFFNHCIKDFTEQDKLSAYLPQYSQNGALFIHTLSDQYIYEDSSINIGQDTFIGHSHRLFKKSVREFYLINAGSVGQNRVDIDLIDYVLWYPKERTAELKQIVYDSDILFKEMKNRHYPDLCFEYLKKKKR